jgi:uncharacterized protein YchJ
MKSIPEVEEVIISKLILLIMDSEHILIVSPKSNYYSDLLSTLKGDENVIYFDEFDQYTDMFSGSLQLLKERFSEVCFIGEVDHSKTKKTLEKEFEKSLELYDENSFIDKEFEELFSEGELDAIIRNEATYNKQIRSESAMLETLLRNEAMWKFQKTQPIIRSEKKIGRNDFCPCMSGNKYKKCCLNKTVS